MSDIPELAKMMFPGQRMFNPGAMVPWNMNAIDQGGIFGPMPAPMPQGPGGIFSPAPKQQAAAPVGPQTLWDALGARNAKAEKNLKAYWGKQRNSAGTAYTRGSGGSS